MADEVDDWDDSWEEPAPLGPGAVAAIAFGIACVLPSAFFLFNGLSEDRTATASAGSTVLVLIGIEVVIGLVLGALGWAAGSSRRDSTRRAMSTVVIVIAVLSGLLTGLLGGAAIAMAKHPTWDDA